MKTVIIIPARFESSRLPGKPLADICGIPMVVRVYQQFQKAARAIDADMYVAGDDKRISDTCAAHDVPYIPTNIDCATGTDRVADAYFNGIMDSFDLVINIQGDEPLMDPGALKAMVNYCGRPGFCGCACGMASVSGEEALRDSVGTVAVDMRGHAVYFSRAAIPATKDGRTLDSYLTQVCIYAFMPWALQDFADMKRGPMELAEDIELLRMLEHGYNVEMVRVPGERLAVDTPEDLEKVRRLFRKQQNKLED